MYPIKAMLNIRLQRVGKRGQAYFRIIVAEHTKKPKGEFLELLGSYDPHKKDLKVDKERVEFWVSKGAQVSPTVNNLMVNHKVWDKPKMESWKPKKKEAVAAPATPAKAAEVPAAPAAEEAPKEEAPPEPAPETPAV